MFSRTHSRAATWSSRPTLAMPSSEVEEPLGAGPPVDHHADDAVPGEPAAVVCGRRAELEHAALDPHHHRQPGRTRVRRPDVEVQAVLGGRGAIHRRERARHVVPVLRRPRSRAARGRRRHLRRLRPQRVASRTPLHASTGCGGRSRCSPNGGAAYGTPRNTCTPSATGPAPPHPSYSPPEYGRSERTKKQCP